MSEDELVEVDGEVLVADAAAFVTSTTTTGAVVHTDGWPSYKRLAKLGYEHRPLSQRAAAPGEQLLPRAHRAVSNLKTWMHGTRGEAVM